MKACFEKSIIDFSSVNVCYLAHFFIGSKEMLQWLFNRFTLKIQGLM